MVEEPEHGDSPRTPRKLPGLVSRFRQLARYSSFGSAEDAQKHLDTVASIARRPDLQELLPVLSGLNGLVLFPGQLAEGESCWVQFEGRAAEQAERPLTVPAEANFAVVLVDVNHPHLAVEALQELARVSEDQVPSVALLLQAPGQARSTQDLVRATSILSAALECPILVQPSCVQDLPAMLALTLKRLEIQRALQAQQEENRDAERARGEGRAASVPDAEGPRSSWGREEHRTRSDPTSPHSSEGSGGGSFGPGSFGTLSALQRAPRSFSTTSLSSAGSAATAAELSPEERSSLVRQVQQECKFLRRLQHPNLPTARTAEDAQLARLLHQPRMPCLKQAISALGRLPEPRSQFVFRQVAAGVSHLHEHRIAHRNLKPENVLLFPGDVPMIVSFSRAVRVSADRLCVEKCGTMPFAAPEILASARYDPAKADVWSLGVVLLEMLCGVNALPRMMRWAKSAPMTEIIVHIRDYFQEPSAFLRYLDGQLGADPEELRTELLLGMLRVDVERRWSSAEVRDCGWAAQAPAASEAPPEGEP